MEIHMKDVNWGVDAAQLTRELAKVLHSSEYERLLPKMNFHVFLKRDVRNGRNHAGWGFLTLPTRNVGLKFLDDYGAPLKNFQVLGRAITFSPSKKECNPETLQRVTYFPYLDPLHLKESEDRVNRLQSRLVNINVLQFGWHCRDDFFSIEWESTSHSECSLAFDAERNEVRISLKKSSGSYFVAMRYGQIKYISLDSHLFEPSIYVSLSTPPSFEQNIGTPRKRLFCLPFDDHARVVPFTSLAVRMICSSTADLATFRNMCKDAQMEGKVDDFETWSFICRRELFSPEVVYQYQDWVEQLPWEVAFQVEAIVRDMHVDLREMLSIKDKIAVVTRWRGKQYASEMLRHFGGRLLVSDGAEGDIFQWFDNAAEEYAKMSKTPILEPTDGSLFQALHVSITPTTMCLEGPFPERSNRIIRSYEPSNHSSFLRVNFVDEGCMTYHFDRDIDGRDFTKRRVGELLVNGLTIAGRHFRFLAYSQSALKEHSVWFVKEFFDNEHGWVTAKSIIESIGQFSDLRYDRNLIYCPARYAARLSQAFTATDASVAVEIEEIQMISDIETDCKKKYCFTDGVGTVSSKLAEDIWDELRRTRRKARNKKTHPKAFQIRFQGSKGMLSVNYRLPGRMLCLRNSMIKFTDPNSHVIEVARAFDRPAPYFMNRPLIMLLEGLGVKFEAFKKYQDLVIEQVHEAILSTNTAAGMLESYGLGTSYTVPSVLLQFHKREIQNVLANEFWKRSMSFATYHVLRELKNHARIPIPNAWTLVGVADEHKFLREGEIFACVKPLTGGTIYLEGDILISRSPTIHPGDVQIVRAIGPPSGSPFENEPLPNTVVFSTEGTRPLPTCLGGGDLDGDLYNLLPLDEMPEFRPRSTETPASYDAAPRRLLDRPSNMEDVADFVVEFINSDVVGIIAINWLIIADQSLEGIFDESCLLLARLHSDAVDYPKTGEPVKLEKIPKLKFKAKPDWNAPETAGTGSAKYYESRRAVGRLFREVDLPKVHSTVNTIPRRRRGQSSRAREREYASGTVKAVSDDIIVEINALIEDYIGQESWVNDESVSIIEQVYERYVSELRVICANNTLSQSQSSSLTEEEAFMGTIIAKTSQPRRRKYLMSKLREQTDLLARGVREELGGDDDTPLGEVLERAWLAWDHALSKGLVFGAQTFGWIALHLIFETAREIDAERKEYARRFY